VDFVNGLDCVKMVDSGLDFHDCDAGLFNTLFRLLHHRADVACGDHIDLLSCGRLDDKGMVSVWNERNSDCVTNRA